MRIIIFSNPDRIVSYPQEGVSAFGKTRRVGSDIIGEYFGAATEGALPTYSGEWPIKNKSYRTQVRPGEIIDLMGAGYAKVYRAAYPQGNKPEDDIALVFVERARNPISADSLIDVNSALVTAALDHFIDQGYITTPDKTRIQQGIEL